MDDDDGGEFFDYRRDKQVFRYKRRRFGLRGIAGARRYLWKGTHCWSGDRVVILNPHPFFAGQRPRPPYVVGVLARKGEAPFLFGGERIDQEVQPKTPTVCPDIGKGSDGSVNFRIFGFGENQDPFVVCYRVALTFTLGTLSKFQLLNARGERLPGAFSVPTVIYDEIEGLSIYSIYWIEADGFPLRRFLMVFVGAMMTGILEPPNHDISIEQRAGVFAAENIQSPPER
ncbi:MAG: hypothetical protein AAGD01_17360 [Acidobacteriota bacterium]